MRSIKPQRGDVWIVDLDYTRGHEQAKTRPCIILSIDAFNQGPAKLVYVVPLTTKFGNRYGHAIMTPPEGGIKEKSYILCEQMRVVSHDRLSGKPIGKVSDETLLSIEYRITALLGFKAYEHRRAT